MQYHNHDMTLIHAFINVLISPVLLVLLCICVHVCLTVHILLPVSVSVSTIIVEIYTPPLPQTSFMLPFYKHIFLSHLSHFLLYTIL